MLTVPRRITLYGLLLLLPTLAVGTGAIVLLRREQARLDAQAQAAAEARRAAIEARARLIAENVELLVGDVQDALMNTLREAPPANPEPFLDEWERTNPLVRATFRLGAGDAVLRPAAGARPEVQAWLKKWLAQPPPWRDPSRPEPQLSPMQQLQRGDIDRNVSQTQSARNAIKDMANRSNVNLKIAPPPSAPAETTGWMPWRDGPQLHLIGWRRLSTGVVVGVDVNLAAVSARFAELLPQDGDRADVFVVRDPLGATLESKSYARDSSLFSKTAPALVTTVPIAAHLLPGLEVVGSARAAADPMTGGAFFLLGTLVVGAFVAAILSGGSLLLWQARRSEQEAAQKTSFVANVSHEFKTPLTTIRLYAELLEQGRVADREKAAEYLRTIGRETQRLARLVNNALDFSRLEQGRKKFAREALDAGAALTRLLDTHAPRIAEAGLALRRELPAAAVVVNADRDALEQIVINLIDNACKYAAEGGELTVTLQAREGGGAQVSVADRGPGVPPEHRERIFEKFHRVDDALTAEKGGAGLGLGIARQLARGMGGELRYRARDGEGAEFVLELP